MLNLRVSMLLHIVCGIVVTEAVSHYKCNNVVGEVIDFKHGEHPIEMCSKHLGIRSNGLVWANYRNYNSATICSTSIRCQNPDEPSALVIDLDETPADGAVCGFIWSAIGADNVCINGKCVEVTLVD